MPSGSGRPRIVIVGSGWAGATLCDKLDDKKYSISLISPETTTPYTPLLASAAAGLYDFSLVEIPIRHSKKNIKYVKGRVQTVDFVGKKCVCTPFFDSLSIKEFELPYDFLLLAPGCTNQTFGTPGVAEHAYFVRNARDAQVIASKINDCFEKASTPGLNEQQQHDMLHFVIVGGGPTGVEISSELHDLFEKDYGNLYPHLKGKTTISIHDVAPNILTAFDSTLQEYALGSFNKRRARVVTGSHILRVTADSIETKESGRVPTGLVIWATGNKSVPLVDNLPVRKTKGLPRIMTDDFLRVFDDDSHILEGVYALGDAADIEGASLPTTAEVACQKADFISDALNTGFTHGFQYRQAALVAYLGGHDGVIAGKEGYTGLQAWMAWRSKNFLWTRTWRQKVLLVVTWMLNLLLGRYNAPS